MSINTTLITIECDGCQKTEQVEVEECEAYSDGMAHLEYAAPDNWQFVGLYHYCEECKEAQS